MATLDTLGHVYLVLSLVGAGVIAGYAAGLFGIGGGVVLVPTFLTIFPFFGASEAVVMHCAIGTSLALIVPGAIMSTRKQREMGNLDNDFLIGWQVVSVVGLMVGVVVVNLVSTHTLKLVFTAYLLLATVYAVLTSESGNKPAGAPRGIVKYLAGFVIGGVSILLGIGGGTFTVPFLRLYDYPIKKAIAVSTATGLLIGFGGAIGAVLQGMEVAGRPPYSWGYVNLLAFVIITPIVMVVSPLGSRTANALPDRLLKPIYAVFLICVTGYMASQVI